MTLARLIGAVAVAWASGLVWADEAVLILPTRLAARIDTGRQPGRSMLLEPRPGGVLATVSLTLTAFPPGVRYPLADVRRCGDPAALEVPASFRLPEEAGRWQRAEMPAIVLVERVVGLVTQRIRLDDDGDSAQDAASVWRLGRGRCSGRANLAVGLLRALGVPARTLSGVLMGADGPRWHRWGEAWLGDAGWVAFDPGAAVGCVSVRYLPLAAAGEGAPLDGLVLVRLDERGFAGLPVHDGLRVVPEGGVRVRCEASRGDEMLARLVGPDGSRWARRGRDEVIFEGMLPGLYRLILESHGNARSVAVQLGATPEVRLAVGNGEAGS